MYVAGLGDSRAYLLRDDRVEQLTVDHSVAEALRANGTLTPEQARTSPWQHVLYKFLGCAEMSDEGTDVRPFTPQAGDRLLLATDGLTNHVSDDDLRNGSKQTPDPQAWAERRDRGSCLRRGRPRQREDRRPRQRSQEFSPAGVPKAGFHRPTSL